MGDDPGNFLTGAKVISRSPQEGPRREGLEDARRLTLKRKEGALSQGVQTALETGKTQNRRQSPTEPSEGAQPCRQLHLRPVRPEPDCHLQNYGRTKAHSLGPLTVVFAIAAPGEYASSLGTREMEPKYQSPFPPRLSTQKGAQRTCDWLTGVLGRQGGDCPALRV